MESIRTRYEAERPTYEQLAKTAADKLRHEGTRQGVGYRVEHRAKDVQSLLKKALFGKTKYTKIIDRAGVRLVLRSVDEIDAVDRVIRSAFKVHKQFDATDRLDDKEFGYGGIHYYLEFADPPEQSLSGLQFECQVHTRAQALWAALSHDLVYKGSGSGPHLRSLHRLAALLELVDLEVVRVQDEAATSPEQTAVKVALVLESFYLLVGKERHDPEITASLVPKLLPLMGTDDADAWSSDFVAFMNEFADRLAGIYERYSTDSRNVIMSQPESLLVLFARARDPYSFDDRWPDELGSGLRESFIGIWPNP